MGTDPTEGPKRWLGFFFLCGLSAITLVTIAVELIFRHGEDYGVWSACLPLIGLIVLGPAGIRIEVRDRDKRDEP